MNESKVSQNPELAGLTNEKSVLMAELDELKRKLIKMGVNSTQIRTMYELLVKEGTLEYQTYSL